MYLGELVKDLRAYFRQKSTPYTYVSHCNLSLCDNSRERYDPISFTKDLLLTSLKMGRLLLLTRLSLLSLFRTCLLFVKALAFTENSVFGSNLTAIELAVRHPRGICSFPTLMKYFPSALSV